MLYDNKKIALLIFSIIGGLCFATYLLYNQRGSIGQAEIIALTFTAVTAIIISVIMVRKANQ